jgi:cellulose synthase/poly-beta-1,6-N-acetylglucosamine synthase-like glycosyltransferase
MLMWAFIIVCACASGILHSYLIYPLWIINRSKGLTQKSNLLLHYPNIAIVMAAYNEEKVITAKLKSIFDTDYPNDKIKLYIGSDASSDNTDNLIEHFKTQHPSLYFKRFDARTGKTAIVNQLVDEVREDILILTDANVMFEKKLLQELVQNLNDERVGIVGAHIIKQSVNEKGIAKQEKTYMQLENRIKLAESLCWQLVIGIEGGCYAIRKSAFTKVPAHFKVDDFHITLAALQKKFKVLFNEKAICYEDVPVSQKVEFKRKVRISTGNFQNLKRFSALIWPIYRPLGFAFFSHKVLRWLTPFLLIVCFISSLYLAICTLFFVPVFLVQLLFILIAMIDYFIDFKVKPIKYISHFYVMNLALLIGFFSYLKGVESGAWEPTARNV